MIRFFKKLKTPKLRREQWLSLGMLGVMCLVGTNAQAFAPPTAGAPFYEIWDMVYNGAFKGSIGNLVALLGVGLGTWQSVVGDWKKGMGAGVGVAGFAKADAVIQTLGVSVFY